MIAAYYEVTRIKRLEAAIDDVFWSPGSVGCGEHESTTGVCTPAPRYEDTHHRGRSPTGERCPTGPAALSGSHASGLGTIAITVWRAAVGFGGPHTVGEPQPVLGSGHETLLRNAGRLLAAEDHAVYIADRYAGASLE